MNRWRFAVLVLLVCGLVSCGGADKATKEMIEKLSTSYDYDGQQVEMTGYLSVPRSILVRGDMIALGLHNSAGQSNDELAKLKVKFGKGENSYYVPEKFRGSDVEIYDATGEQHGYLTCVKVKGTVKYTNKEWNKRIQEFIDGTPYNEDDLSQGQVRELKDMEERKKVQNGDPNNYAFEIIVDEITVP